LTLRKKQRLFSRLIAELIIWAYEQGYEVSVGDAYRDPRAFGEVGVSKGYGRARSNHKSRLAMDLNLFKDGKYLDKTEDHGPVGAKWESMHPLCRWGGRFNDGNHYSLEHEGRM